MAGQVSRFLVERHGTFVGEVLQENVLFSPQFRLIDATGATLRVANNKPGAYEWQVQDLAGQPLGYVTRLRSKDPERKRIENAIALPFNFCLRQLKIFTLLKVKLHNFEPSRARL